MLQGHASLSAEFELLRNLAPAPIPSAIDQGDADRGESARVFAAEWFTYRKRGRLAPYGIGTIDQALPAHREPLALIATGRIVAFEPQLDPVTESAREEVLDVIRGQLQSWLDFFSGLAALTPRSLRQSREHTHPMIWRCLSDLREARRRFPWSHVCSNAEHSLNACADALMGASN